MAMLMGKKRTIEVVIENCAFKQGKTKKKDKDNGIFVKAYANTRSTYMADR